MVQRFLFALWDGGGTAPPELAVVSRLVRRGHTATVLGDPSLAEDVAATGARFVPWRDAPHRASRAAEDEIIRDWAALTPLGALARARDRHAFKPAHLFAREVTDEFRAHPVDVVVADAMLFGALVGGEATKAPVAALLPMTSFLPAAGRPPPSLGLSPAHNATGRLRDRVLYAAGDALLWRSCLPWLNLAREKVGLEPVAHPLDQLRRIDRVLVQTSAWFDFDAPRSSGNVRYVGPELDDPAWAAPPDAALVGPGDPLVIVGLSTTYMGQDVLLRKVIRALAPLRVRALVTTGPGLDPANFPAPPHVRVCRSAAHSAVMPHASLVVTHAGHGTVIRALACGVPLVCLPMGRDQSDNAARVVACEAGVWLSRHASTARLRRAIESALTDDRLRRGAERARTALAKERVGDPVIEELEALHA